MARKKGARSVPAQLAIGSAADLGFLLVLTAIASALVLSGVIGQGNKESNKAARIIVKKCIKQW